MTDSLVERYSLESVVNPTQQTPVFVACCNTFCPFGRYFWDTFLRIDRDLREKKLLNSFIQIDENDWKAFLEDLAEFEKKYQRLLSRLDAAESRPQSLNTPEKKEVGSEEALPQVPVKSPEKGMGVEAKGGFLSWLKTKLQAAGTLGRSTRPGFLGKPQSYAVCSRCGFPIVRATRFCQRCGAGFGKLVCSCGSELGSGDRFCDRCGRQV